MRRFLPLPALPLILAACAAALPLPEQADLSAALVARTGETPPATPEGACWTAAVTPAVIETVTEHALNTPEQRAADGTVTAATVRSETRQQVVTERRDVWFQAPCDAALTPEVVASLQRALQARGGYSGLVTGELDAPTRRAIQRWQRDRGLDSDVLALATAQALGILPGRF